MKEEELKDNTSISIISLRSKNYGYRCDLCNDSNMMNISNYLI